MGWPRFSVSFLALALAACGSSERPSSFQEAQFASFTGKTILCFDLRPQNGVPTGGLITRIGTSATPRRDFLLPFPARDIRPNRALLLTSGSYDRFAILSMSFGTSSLGSNTIAFTPQLQPLNLTAPQLEALDPGVYFQANGLDRWFVFIDASQSLTTELAHEFPFGHLETFDSVAVAIPERAEGREVRRGFTVFPPPTVRLKNVMFFARPRQQGPQRVELRYAVPPTAAQVAASSSGLKLLLVLVVPVITLVFLDPEDIQRPKLRLAAIWGGLALQIAVVVFVVWGALSVGPPSAEAWVDFAIAAIGVISEIVVILVKSKAGKAHTA